MFSSFFTVKCRPVIFLGSVLLLFLGVSQQAWGDSDAEKFKLWVEEFKVEAIAAGISQATFDRAFSGVEPLARIIESDRNQPEFKRTLDDYLAARIDQTRISKGRKLLRQYWTLFAAVSEEFQVQARFLVALWGIETDFGRIQGRVPVIQALATLTYDPRRSDYFKRELLNALRILDQEKASLEQLKGSWAGAMGQVQFMPSVFLKYGTDYDGDGRVDLWQSEPDAMASAANYLGGMGWNFGWTWGREVSVPADFDPQLQGLDIQLRLSDWQKLGVRRLSGEDLPAATARASLIRPDGPAGRSFLIYDNYRKLLNWNRSHKFAIAVGLLADRIGVP